METYRKVRVEDGEVILERVLTVEMRKKRVLKRLNTDLVDLQVELDRLQDKKAELQARITEITKIV